MNCIIKDEKEQVKELCEGGKRKFNQIEPLTTVNLGLFRLISETLDFASLWNPDFGPLAT